MLLVNRGARWIDRLPVGLAAGHTVSRPQQSTILGFATSGSRPRPSTGDMAKSSHLPFVAPGLAHDGSSGRLEPARRWIRLSWNECRRRYASGMSGPQSRDGASATTDLPRSAVPYRDAPSSTFPPPSFLLLPNFSGGHDSGNMSCASPFGSRSYRRHQGQIVRLAKHITVGRWPKACPGRKLAADARNWEAVIARMGLVAFSPAYSSDPFRGVRRSTTGAIWRKAKRKADAMDGRRVKRSEGRRE